MRLDKLFAIAFITFIHLLDSIPILVQYSFSVIIVVSMACLLIGSKIEEELRPVSKIVKTFYAIYQKRVGLPITELTETDPVATFIFASS